MRIFIAIILPLCLHAARQTAEAQAPAPNKTLSSGSQPAASTISTKKAKPQRVHVRLDGFELEKKTVGQMGMTQIGGGSRGNEPTFALYAPKRGRVFSLRPTFYWAAADNKQDFVFRVFNEDGDVEFENKVNGSSAQYPKDAPPLQPGKTYSWSAAYTSEFIGNAGVPVEFVVLNENERKLVAAELSQADPVHQAAIFTSKRLWYDAVDAYSQLISQNPDDPEFYERRGEIYDQLAVTKSLALADFRKADNLRDNRE